MSYATTIFLGLAAFCYCTLEDKLEKILGAFAFAILGVLFW